MLYGVQGIDKTLKINLTGWKTAFIISIPTHSHIYKMPIVHDVARWQALQAYKAAKQALFGNNLPVRAK